MIVNYRFEQYSYDQKKYEYHRECFELLFIGSTGNPPKEDEIPPS